MRQDFRYWLDIPVRWADMDTYGHVNNAKYFTYCESSRMGWFDAIELYSFRQAPQHGPALVTATCNFRRQVHHPASLDVGARATRIGSKSFQLEYELYHQGDGQLVADGSSVVVWVDYESSQAIPLPEALKERIRHYEGLED